MQRTQSKQGKVCKATVIERNKNYRRGPNGHNHPGRAGHNVAAEIIEEVKQQALNDVFCPASQIVERVMLECVGDAPLAGLPKPNHLARQANRQRQSQRSKDPKDLDFELCCQYLPEGKFKRSNPALCYSFILTRRSLRLYTLRDKNEDANPIDINSIKTHGCLNTLVSFLACKSLAS